MTAIAKTQLLVAPVITEGQQLPELKIPVTATLIATGAVATRDFQKVHHDKSVAQAAGTPDIFMNILTTNCLVNRYVSEFSGPLGRIKKINIRLGAPNYPGDEMTFTGTVQAVQGERIVLAINGTNSLGPHVTGTVELTFESQEETR
ncbi:MaoC family dehydratase [Arthrobacter sp. MYb213]|uniref:MaoC family dehydratase n=1 Tax=Arthrobacter sp. MYb213 TaxID=1848595 RepID=UPI000CFB21C8|nr:MaoC family dehydratase [Arthrobacter sp. MYb213]PRB70400.1 acyl dehydratase [Arthrobacter sp. MYb213]